MSKLDTMTVGELKVYLEEFPDDKKVVFAYSSGDYWMTELVGTITKGDYDNIKYDNYHSSFSVSKDGKGEEVLVLG